MAVFDVADEWTTIARAPPVISKPGVAVAVHLNVVDSYVQRAGIH